MSHGGQREGAGRPKGAANLLTNELRAQINASELIQFLQDLAGGRVAEASISERKEAAVALLKKVMPDCKHMEIDQTGEQEQLREQEAKRAREVRDWMKKLSPAAREEVFNAVEAIEEEPSAPM